jgi:hypothetical protein
LWLHIPSGCVSCRMLTSWELEVTLYNAIASMSDEQKAHSNVE